MGKLSCHVRRLRAGMVLVALAAMLAAPVAALADSDGDEADDQGRAEHLTCLGNKDLVSIDEQICPANSRRVIPNTTIPRSSTAAATPGSSSGGVLAPTASSARP